MYFSCILALIGPDLGVLVSQDLDFDVTVQDASMAWDAWCTRGARGAYYKVPSARCQDAEVQGTCAKVQRCKGVRRIQEPRITAGNSKSRGGPQTPPAQTDIRLYG